MNAEQATDILRSLSVEKRQEALKLYNFLGERMKGKTPQGGNWDELSPQIKLVLKFAFAIEYGRRTAGNEPTAKAKQPTGQSKTN